MNMEVAPAGPQMLSDEIRVGEYLHPVEAMQRSRFAHGEQARLAQMQEMHGLALPMRHKFMEQILVQQRRLAPLESSYTALDLWRGDHTTIGWEEYLNAPENSCEMRKNTHHLMEEQVFGRVLEPVHTKDIL
eukprot:TRINITY_DN10437_c0_g1_i1.p1 TRINITY_DN10437_c0_g1~~TRINITY_DN10437_c0_g1_i1.p1  ORF type:complete len:132 (+),score=37.88 TRINITY_DN10437_c0_g1_i1:47-442(+)